MLKKQDLVVGQRIKIRDVIKDGLIGGMGGGGDSTMPYLPLQRQPRTGGPNCSEVQGMPGDILTLASKTKRKDGVNIVEVHRLGDPAIYYVFWCALRVSCDHVD